MQRSQNRPKRIKRQEDVTSNSSETSGEIDEDDIREFLEHMEKRDAAERDRQVQEALALREKEEKEKAEVERLKRKEIEDEAIKVWLAEQQLKVWDDKAQQQQKNSIVREMVRKELERLKLSPNQIEKAMAHTAMEDPAYLLNAAPKQDQSPANGISLGFSSTQKKNRSRLGSLRR